MLALVIRLAAFLLIGYVVWLMLRPRYTVKIVMDDRGIRRHQGLPKGQEARVLGFLEQQVAPQGRLGIYAVRRPNGYLRLDFKGRIDPGTRQRIRNVLITVL